jgi:hypothetical protein
VTVHDEKLAKELDETAQAQKMTTEDLIVLLLQKTMAPWSKVAKALDGE